MAPSSNTPERDGSRSLRHRNATVSRPLLRRLVVIVLLLIGTWTVLQALAGLVTDVWWYRSVGQIGTFRRRLVASVGLWLLAFSLSAAAVGLTVRRLTTVAQRLRPDGRTVWSGWLSTWTVIATAGSVGPILGNRWEELLLAIHGWRERVGGPAVLGTDPGFSVFRLPILQAITAWLTALAAACALITVLVSAVTGLLERQGERFMSRSRSVINLLVGWLAVMCLGIAGAMWWARFTLASGRRGAFVGLFTTDNRVRVPAFSLLALAALVVSGSCVMVLRPRRRSDVLIRSLGPTVVRTELLLPAVGAATWLTTALLTIGIVPPIYQSWIVKPNSKAAGELKNARLHMEATLAAHNFLPTPGRVATSASPAGLADQVLLWDDSGSTVLSDLVSTQTVRSYYRFRDVDVDRYKIDGKVRPVVISTREIEPASEGGWINRVLTYTHGFGVAIAQADKADDERLQYLLGGFSYGGVSPRLDRPQLFVGDGLSGYAVVGTRVELATPIRPTKPATAIALNSTFRQVAFAIRFGDLDILRGKDITSGSSVMFRRSVVERVRATAPFLRFDADPYPVVLGGRVVWVVDAYTVTDNFPGGQRVDRSQSGVSSRSGLASGFNYVRHSVKAVVDGSSGTVRLYRTDLSDPIVRVWNRAFPTLFRTAETIERDYPGLGEHLRYPRDLLSVQTSLFGTYRHFDPESLISGENQWVPSPDVRGTGEESNAGEASVSRSGDQPSFAANRAAPQYRMLQLEGDATPQFVTVQTTQTATRGEGGILTGMLVGSSDQAGRLSLRFVQVDDTQGFDNAARAIASDETVSRITTPLDQKGSAIQYGPLQPVLLPNSRVLYVRALYVQATRACTGGPCPGASPPRLVRLIGYDGDRVLTSSTAAGLFAASSGSGPTAINDSDDPLQALRDARDALAESERELQEAQRRIDELLEKLSQGVDVPKVSSAQP
jgi:uncharacterized protein